MSNRKKESSFKGGTATIVILVIGWLIAPNFFRFLRDNDINMWVSAIVAATVITGIYKFAFSFREEKLDEGQQERDELAHRIFEKIDENEFSIYLRPFNTAGKLKSSITLEYGNNLFERNLINYKTQIILNDLETILAYILENESPLVALGRTNEYGAGKLDSSDGWQNNFEKLINYAQLIFIVPLNSRSTKWEIANIVNNNLLYKCIFIMPSELADLNANEEWDNAINEYSKLKLHLPAYNCNGLLFAYDSTCSISWSISLSEGMSKESLLQHISFKLNEVSKVKVSHADLDIIPYENLEEIVSPDTINDNDSLQTNNAKSQNLETAALLNVNGLPWTTKQTTEELTVKVGKKNFLDEDITLAAKLNYVSGIQAFDEYFKGQTLKQLNAVIYLTKYPKGLVFKISKNFSSFSFGLAYSEIKQNVLTERPAISHLTFEMNNKAKIIFSLKTSDIYEVKIFFDDIHWNYKYERISGYN